MSSAGLICSAWVASTSARRLPIHSIGEHWIARVHKPAQQLNYKAAPARLIAAQPKSPEVRINAHSAWRNLVAFWVLNDLRGAILRLHFRS